MQTQTQAAVARPRAYWWIAVLALVWNLIGLAMFFSQMLMDGAQVMQLSEAQRAVYLATPGWVNLAFAFAVIAGVLGALCLLLRRRLAVPMFAISLLALLVQVVGGYLVTPAWAAYGAGGVGLAGVMLGGAQLVGRWERGRRGGGWLGGRGGAGGGRRAAG